MTLAKHNTLMKFLKDSIRQSNNGQTATASKIIKPILQDKRDHQNTNFSQKHASNQF